MGNYVIIFAEQYSAVPSNTYREVAGTWICILMRYLTPTQVGTTIKEKAVTKGRRVEPARENDVSDYLLLRLSHE